MLALRRNGLCVSESTAQQDKASGLGWHRRLAMPSTAAPWPFHLAQSGYLGLYPDRCPMEMAGDRCRLAASGGCSVGTLAGVSGGMETALYSSQ